MKIQPIKDSSSAQQKQTEQINCYLLIELSVSIEK